MYRILGSWIKPKEHARVGLVSWNILPSFVFTSATLNNAVYVISVSQALITMARRQPEAEDRLCRFFRVGFRFRFFSETASLQ